MKVDDVHARVAGVPHMRPGQAAAITQLILERGCADVLELGFCHGVSTCYLAGAVEELGRGHVTTIDLESARDLAPPIGELLGRVGLARLVTVIHEPTSYVWRLMRFLDEDPAPRFDLCYIDGAHDWFTDGFAFLLVDRLLRPGGVVVFDDLDWTFAASPALGTSERVRRMPDDERTTAQVRKVYELLVKPHPGYDRFVEKDGWAYAYKSAAAPAGGAAVRTEVVVEPRYVGVGGAALRLWRKLVR